MDFVGLKCVVTTAHRGVFYGEVLSYDPSTKVVEMANSRVAVYWPTTVRGFIGLAFTGPLPGSRISPAAPFAQYMDVSSILVCTENAAAAWESGIWE